MAHIAVLEGLRRRRRKHSRRAMGAAPKCQFGVNKRTKKCLKHKRARRKSR